MARTGVKDSLRMFTTNSYCMYVCLLLYDIIIRYVGMLVWTDQIIAYFVCGKIVNFDIGCFAYNKRVGVVETECERKKYRIFLCEFDSSSWNTDKEHGEKNIRIPMLHPGNASFAVPKVTCPAGHVTHAFLACDEQSVCWSSRHRYGESGVWGIPSTPSCPAPLTSLPAMFTCTSEQQRVPYSVVCDHHQHCVDESDEDFCSFPPCSGPTPVKCATSSQCVSQSDFCNGQGDCKHDADERTCGFYFDHSAYSIPPPAIVHLTPLVTDQETKVPFVKTPLTQSGENTSSSSPCPRTHFQCPDNGLCLPVFLLCNGVKDCPGQEDEVGCDTDSVSCPGFYRCRSSAVCLHPSHVCDGVHQCPQQEDETFCHLVCPVGCACHGLAFTCHQPFVDELHQDVRYMDASDSGLKPEHLGTQTLLIHLSLSRCQMKIVSNLTFPNLRSLDLSYNDIYVISVNDLQEIPKVQFLFLSNNPVKSLFTDGSKMLAFSSLRTLDMSGIKMQTLNTYNFSVFHNLETLNLSNCGVDRVEGESFHTMNKLRVLDFVGCTLTQFHPGLLSGLDHLQTVRADNFKLCCPEILPPGFNLANCKAPVDEVSSCESLLRSDVYRVFLSLFSSLALIGNFGCFLVRHIFLKSGKSGFGVFVTHLSISDFLMGIYLAVIGVADQILKGSYPWKDISWRHSVPCRMAGFLSLLSNEVSAFIICLITLDRFLVLRFPFSGSLHFKARSAHITCAVVWAVALVMAAVPLTPMTSHWSFYSRTGICVPLPVTRKDFAGRHYSFGVLIVFNFILFLLIALGQAGIYVSIRANRMPTIDSTKTSNDLRIARRLISVAVSDFLCWFPIGLLGLLASRGVPVPGELNVGMAVLVLPLNSALNPFLYTVNVVLERRRKSREGQLLKQLIRQLEEETRN